MEINKIVKIVENPIVQLLVVIAVVIFAYYKCSDTASTDSKQSSKTERKNIIENGIMTVSIFKTKDRESHIWTHKEVKTTNQADLLRADLGLCEDIKMYLYSDSTLNEGNYYASHLSVLSKNQNQSFSGKIKGDAYVENNDTIRLLHYENGNICNMYSSVMLQNKDIPFLNRALKAFSVNSTNTIFLFSDKNEIGENYYASYDWSFIHNKVTKDELLNNIISEIKSDMIISNTGNILAFLDKIEKAKKGISPMSESAKYKANNILLAFQKKHFPMARKVYYKNAKDELWEKNIEVSMSGRDITFTGYMFVDNKVKKDTYLEIKDELAKLRFKSVGFRAFDGDDKTYWELDSKKDSDI